MLQNNTASSDRYCIQNVSLNDGIHFFFQFGSAAIASTEKRKFHFKSLTLLAAKDMMLIMTGDATIEFYWICNLQCWMAIMSIMKIIEQIYLKAISKELLL